MTQSRVVEIFRDKLPYRKEVELGSIYIVKGEYSMNYFNEKIIRGYKLKEISLEDEFLFYLEIQQEQQAKKDKYFQEEEVIKQSSNYAGKLYEASN